MLQDLLTHCAKALSLSAEVPMLLAITGARLPIHACCHEQYIQDGLYIFLQALLCRHTCSGPHFTLCATSAWQADCQLPKTLQDPAKDSCYLRFISIVTCVCCCSTAAFAGCNASRPGVKLIRHLEGCHGGGDQVSQQGGVARGFS